MCNISAPPTPTFVHTKDSPIDGNALQWEISESPKKMPVTKISQNEEFAPFVNNSAGKLVVLDFYADWCGPCKAIAPFVEELSNTYSENAVFAKVDIQSCDTIADSFKVSGIPYFVLMRDGRIVDTLTGAKKDALREKIEAAIAQMKAQGGAGGAAGAGVGSDGLGAPTTLYGISKAIDLVTQIDKSKSECLNEDDEHPWTNAVIESANSACLKSDCDEQLLLRIVFVNKVKLFGLKLVGTGSSCPTPNKIRLFINQTNSLDFDKAESGTPTLDLNVEKSSCLEDSDAINLPKLKFANVENITIFIPGNSEEDDVTVLKSLIFIGQTHGAQTDMANFKRVAGKVGERD